MASDVLHLLRSFRANLDQFDQHKLTAQAEAEILATCEERILPTWREHWQHANALVEPIMDQPLELRATKRFTELVLTPEFMAGAIWNRSYTKPLGYPGDFKIMSMVYDWQREGKTLYEKLSHHLGLDVAECIATRMTEGARTNPEREKKLMRAIPMQRWGEPDEIASAILFLASPAASYITGQSLAIDGGLMLR